MKTFLPQNKFYSAVDIPSAAGSAGATPCPQPRAPAVPFSDDENGQGTAAIDSCQEPVAADLLQALGALSGTDLIHEIFDVKPKHFKLKHKRRLKLPPFAPDYEAMEAAMHNPHAPRALEGDPIWADPAPLFLRGRA